MTPYTGQGPTGPAQPVAPPTMPMPTDVLVARPLPVYRTARNTIKAPLPSFRLASLAGGLSQYFAGFRIDIR